MEITWKKAKDKATLVTTINNQGEQLDNILNKLNENDKYWREQMEFNGSVNSYIRLDVEH